MNSNTTLFPRGSTPASGKKTRFAAWMVALLLMITGLTAQAQLPSYTFSSTVDTYTPITGGTVLGTTTTDDQSFVDETVPAGATGTVTGVGLPIGFNFTFNGITFDRFGINANGWIFLGQSALTPAVTNIGNSYVPLSVANTSTPPQLRSRIAAFARDLNAQTGAELRYQTIGTAPNRTLVVQFTNYRRYNQTGDNLNFQIRLHEGSNNVSLVYGTMTVSAASTIEVGLGGANNADFFSRTSATDWVSSTSSTINTATMPISATVFPASGTTFTFAAPTCFVPTALAIDSVTNTTVRINWRAPFSAPATNYQYAVTTSSTPPASGTTTSDTTAAITGLTASTVYNVFVRSNCGSTSGFSNWAGPLTFITGGPISSVASGLWSNPATWAGGAVPGPASTVTIGAADSVILDVNAAVTSLTVNGVLGVNAAAQRVLTVNGATTVAASGSINFGVPTTGTSLRILDFKGAFNHAGTSNFANGNAVWSFSGTTAQTISLGGTLTNNAVGQLLANNAAGLTLSTPLTVGFNVDLINGAFNIGSNLTIDFAATSGTNSQVRRSPLGSFVGTPTITSTVYNVQYVFFTGQTSAMITEGTEIPASRTVNAFTISNPAGVTLTGNLTVTAASSALVLTNGIINLPAGGKIISTATGFAPTVGSNTSFINGGLEVSVLTTANTTRNFPVGSVVNGVASRAQVVIANIITGAGNTRQITVMPVGAPSGSGVAPVTTPMGPRAFEITATGSLGTGTTVALNWQADDAAGFFSTLANIRVVQAPALNGPWTARSATSTAGSLTGTGTRTTTAVNPFTNGAFFAWGTTGVAELSIVGLAGPNMQAPCLTANEVIRAVVRNTGGGTVDYSTNNLVMNATVTTPSGTVINLTPVTRNTGSLAANTNDTITFATSVNMVAQGKYALEIRMDSLAGQVRTDDTLRTNIRSHQVNAVAVPGQIITGQSATVRVTSSERMRITEYTQFFGGTGQTPVYPSFVTSNTSDPDLLEMTNLGSLPADLSGHKLDVYGVGARTYTFPQGTIVPPFAVVVIHVGTGTDQPQNNFYNTGGANGTISSTSQTGYVLRDTAGAIIDAVATNGFAFPASANVSGADWSGSIPNSSAGGSLLSADVNRSSSWVVATAAAPQTMGSLNPGLVPDTATVSWAGPGGFTASTVSASTGVRNTAATENYTATVSYGSCVKTSVASLSVVLPIPPIAGFTVSADSATTGGIVSTITLTDTSLNIPFTRRWTITPNTFQYVNNTNDSSIAPQVRFNAVGSYNVKLFVSNPAGADSLTRNNAVVVTLAYCASNATNSADTKIDSVVIGNTITGSAQATCETYTNYTNLGVAGIMVKGQANLIQVKSGYCGSSSYGSLGKVFVDANKNGLFEANEEAATFGPLAATGSGAAREWFNVNLYVNGAADTGVTRMRIIWQEATTLSEVQGCGTYAYGETEDYNIRLVNPTVAAQPFLVAPANNVLLNVNGPASSTAAINWRPAMPFNGTAQSAVRYTWQLASRAAGNFNAPLLSLASNNAGADTALVLNFQQLDAALAGLSVAVGDTVKGMWRVRAVVGSDTVYSFQTWNIDIRRGTVTDALAAFNLLAPANGTVLPVAGPGSQSVNISWNRSIEGNNNPVTYQWLAVAPGGNFNTPIVSLDANNNGADTVLTLTYAQIDALLASLNFNVGDSAILDWTVRATSGSFNRLAVQTWRVRLFRGGIAPLRLAVAPVGTTTTQVRAPNGLNTHTFLRAATFVPASELAAAGIDSGESIVNLAFRLTAGASVPNKGRFTLYLGNGQNTTYSRGTAWTGAINGLAVAYDDSLSLRTAAGLMTLQLSQPFVYTGGSIEIAYDWAAVAPFAVSPGIATYAANSAIGGSLVSAASATAVPTTLGATAFRPEFVWGVDDRKANEVEVITMFAKGRNPRQWGAPEVVQAIVRNNGYQTRNNLGVTLNVTGANTFTNTQTVAALGIDSVATVNFANFSGTALGFNNMTVSVPNDDVNANNSKNWVQQQTDSIYSYNDSSLTGLGGVGYNTGSGLLLTRYTVTGQRSIRAARMRISNTAAIIGNGLYAVVLNDSGVILAQSAPRVIAAADTNQWVIFSFPNPVNINNGNFYIGMAQPANATTGYFPMAFQTENPTRANAYYTAALNGTGLAQVAGFRLMIEAHVGAPVIPVDSLSRFSLVAPGNNTVVNLQGDPAQTVNIRWNQSRRSVGTTPVTYQWLLDLPGTTFTNPVVRVNAGTDTSITFTYGQIVDTLAAKGIAVGAGFVGRWSVRATSDSLSRLATLPFNLTLNRGVMTSIEETDFSKSIVIYPNPAAYTAKLQVTGSDKDLAITVVNAVGQEMKKFTVNSGVRNEIEIDLANLNEGLYFVRISNGSNMAIKRLMIQR